MAVHAILVLLQSHFISFSIFVLASHPSLGMTINRKIKQRAARMRQKKILLHELPYTKIAKSRTNRLVSGLKGILVL